MNYILITVMSSAMFLPTTITTTSFDSMEACELALREVKKEWVTVNGKSRCVDLAKSRRVFEAQKKLQKALEGK